MIRLSDCSRQIPHLLSLLIVMLPLLAGCSRSKKVFNIDPHFSYNLIRTPAWFPDQEQKPPPVEQEVLDERGRPDFIRLWWHDSGDLITSSDLAAYSPHIIGEKLQTMRKSWIYLQRNEEVIFSRDGSSFVIREVTDPVKLVATYGDPNTRSLPAMRNNKLVETWIWIEHGLQVELADGVEIKRSYPFKGTGTGTYILK